MKVDIIVATYKRYDLLQEALKSVANQSYPHWKCWIAEERRIETDLWSRKTFSADNRLPICPQRMPGYPLFPEIAPFGRNCSILRHWMMMISGCLKAGKSNCFMESHSDCVLLGCNGFLWEGTRELNNAQLYFERKKNVRKINYNNFVTKIILSILCDISKNAYWEVGTIKWRASLQSGQGLWIMAAYRALGEIWNLTNHL